MSKSETLPTTGTTGPRACGTPPGQYCASCAAGNCKSTPAAGNTLPLFDDLPTGAPTTGISGNSRERSSSAAIEFTMPWPPSMNSYWRSSVAASQGQLISLVAASRKGLKELAAALMRVPPRVKLSTKGREYRTRALGELLAQNVTWRGLEGPVSIHIRAHPPTRRKFDLDNLPKAMLDALTHAAVWEDDSQVVDLRITKESVIKGGLMVISITPVAPTP